MKPSSSVLLSGSSLFLALEGTSHSILRLKSILQQASPGQSYTHSLGFYQVSGERSSPPHSCASQGRSKPSSVDCIGKLSDGSWGLLASSSARLAHDLLLYSFESLIAASLCRSLPLSSSSPSPSALIFPFDHDTDSWILLIKFILPHSLPFCYFDKIPTDAEVSHFCLSKTSILIPT